MIKIMALCVLLKMNASPDTMLLPVHAGKIVPLDESAHTRISGIIISPTCDYNIRSCSAGRVQSVWSSGSDWNVMINLHDTIYTYAQMDSFYVNPGQYVDTGDLIGERKMITGDYNSILFIVMVKDKELDPKKFIRYQ
jgi:Peptidase family M23